MNDMKEFPRKVFIQ